MTADYTEGWWNLSNHTNSYQLILNHIKSSNHCFRDPFEIIENVVIEPPPSISLKSKSQQLKLATALLSISPKHLKTGDKSRVATNKQIKQSMQFNESSMILVELHPSVCESQGVFYSSDDMGENCLSSKDFRQFSPIKDKDQLIVCSQRKE